MSSVDEQLAVIEKVNKGVHNILVRNRPRWDAPTFQEEVAAAYEDAGLQIRQNIIKGWMELTLNGGQAFEEEQRADILVKSVPDILAELYNGLGENPAPFFEVMQVSWRAAARKTSEFKVPVSNAHERVASRGDATSIPYRMDQILTGHAYAADYSAVMREFYEEPGLFSNEKETVDLCYAAHYVARLTLSDILFVLELKHAQDGRDNNERAFMAAGIAQVIRRLATILQQVARKDTQPRVILGAASNGYKIVFIRMEENPEAFSNAWAAPYFVSRSEVLPLSQLQEALTSDERPAEGAGAIPSRSRSRNAVAVVASTGSGAHSSPHPEYSDNVRAPLACSNEKPPSAVSDIPLGFFALLLVLRHGTIVERLIKHASLGICVPNADGWSGYKPVRTEPFARGGYACIYELINEAGDRVVWKTVRHQKDCTQLTMEHKFLTAKLHGCPHIITCHHAEVDAGGQYAALVLGPVGISVSDMRAHTPDALNVHTLVKHMTAALRHCHSHIVCHRDVRPCNIVYVEAEDAFKLIDFGLATDTGTSKRVEGVDVYLHDDILLAAAGGKQYKAHPRHDDASLAYTIMTLVDSYGSYPRARKHDPAPLVALRRDWVKTWLATCTDEPLVAIVKELLQWKDDDAVDALAARVGVDLAIR
jgi:hypothetical protein